MTLVPRARGEPGKGEGGRAKKAASYGSWSLVRDSRAHGVD